MGLIRTALLKASDSKWLANQARTRRFAKRATSRFIPGENLDAALAAAEQLRQRGLTAVLTELGENVATDAEVDDVAQHYDEVLERVEQRSLPAHISVKLTHLGLDLSRDVCAAHVSTLVSAATARGNFVWIDMEGSDYTDLTLDVYPALPIMRSSRASAPASSAVAIWWTWLEGGRTIAGSSADCM